MKPVTPVSDPAALTAVVTEEKSVSRPEASAEFETQVVKKDDSAVV